MGITIAVFFSISLPSSALTIKFNDVTVGGAINRQALQGFNEAASIWSSLFTDPTTIRIDIAYQPILGSPLIPGSTLGYATSATVSTSVSQVLHGLRNDALSSFDQRAIAHLPATNVSRAPSTAGREALIYLTTEPSPSVPNTSRVLDNDGSNNNSVLNAYRANLKGLNLLIDDGETPDGSITFNSDVAFDFDRSDGISADSFDFVGVALHEIGHILGFTSGVADVDGFSEILLDDYRIFSVLDLFRYSEESLREGPGILDLAAGGTPYFSIDGGVTNSGLFSTGPTNGDGQQPGHWKDFLGLGLWDPSLSKGELGKISSLDLLAFDVIGWDRAAVAFEPSVLMLFASGMLGMFWIRRFKPKSAQVRVDL
ncbi:MAG: PEP-CTERM sorting domain-containing protein [Gammaproteobacteria bacterium]|nr:PEP-CTERM sorting domain-containing protein [Gammaproteobacteria bacterium]